MDTITLRISLLGAGLLGGIAISAACSNQVKNDAHCFYHEGNSTCAARYADEGLIYCGTVCLDQDGNPPSPHKDGCVDFVPDDGCYSPCGGEQDVTEEDMCSGVADTGNTEPSTTEPTATMTTSMDTTEPTATQGSVTLTSADTSTTDGPGGCTDSSECDDPNSPICLDEVCQGCSEADEPDVACAAKDAGLGVCGNDGACVQCTVSSDDACEGTTPLCDEGANTCIGCTEHEQCGESACALDTGECLDDCALEVDGDGGADATSVQAAVDMVGEGEGCTILVHADTYLETVVIDGGKQIGLLAVTGEEAVIIGDAGAGIEVSDGAVLYARELQSRQNGSDEGLTVSGAGSAAWLDACQVVDNNGGGIVVSSGGYLWLRNSTVGGSADVPALAVNGGSSDILYSTVLGNLGASPALTCSGTVTVNVRNSIMASRAAAADDLDCDDASMTFTATEVAVPGEGNTAIGSLDVADTTAWFETYNSGDFSLLAAGGTIFEGIAQWQSGDPQLDIDGDPRPNVDGTMDYAGADLLP